MEREPTPREIAEAAAAEMRKFLNSRERLLREFGKNFSVSAFRDYERALAWRDYSHCRG